MGLAASAFAKALRENPEGARRLGLAKEPKLTAEQARFTHPGQEWMIPGVDVPLAEDMERTAEEARWVAHRQAPLIRFVGGAYCVWRRNGGKRPRYMPERKAYGGSFIQLLTDLLDQADAPEEDRSPRTLTRKLRHGDGREKWDPEKRAASEAKRKAKKKKKTRSDPPPP